MGPKQLKKYPLQLIKMMTRYGEELLWANDVKKSDAVFKFVVKLSSVNLEKVRYFRIYFRLMYLIKINNIKEVCERHNPARQ